MNSAKDINNSVLYSRIKIFCTSILALISLTGVILESIHTNSNEQLYDCNSYCYDLYVDGVFTSEELNPPINITSIFYDIEKLSLNRGVGFINGNAQGNANTEHCYDGNGKIRYCVSYTISIVHDPCYAST